MYHTETKHLIFDNPKKIELKFFIKLTLSFLLSFFYKIKLNLIFPREKRTLKYKVSICAIFKNEAKYLREWIEFHKIVGVEHFYLYNNFSTDDYLSVLTPYIDSGLVTLIDWPVMQGQMSAYRDCVEKIQNETQWIGSGQTHVKIFCFKSLNYYLKNAQNGKIPLGWNYAFKRKSGRNRRF